jgi:hypothetical protein
LTSLSIRQKVLEGFGILEGVLFGRRLRSCPTRQSVRIFKDKIFPNSLKRIPYSIYLYSLNKKSPRSNWISFFEVVTALLESLQPKKGGLLQFQDFLRLFRVIILTSVASSVGDYVSPKKGGFYNSRTF